MNRANFIWNTKKMHPLELINKLIMWYYIRYIDI
jgi:hypothetical protein